MYYFLTVHRYIYMEYKEKYEKVVKMLDEKVKDINNRKLLDEIKKKPEMNESKTFIILN